MKTTSLRQAESGNILVYILGAIVLIGALTLMVRGSSTPGASIDEENLIIKVSEVQDYGRELEQAIAFIFQNGHSESDIRFAHPDADSAYGTITDIPTRQVFHRDGGGATYRAPPSGIQIAPTDWLFSGTNTIEKVGTDCAAYECAELLAILPDVTRSFCLLMNEKNGIDSISNEPPQTTAGINITTPFVGNFTGANNINHPSGSFDSKLEGCVEGAGTPPAGTYHYYRVLLPR
jgi:hypothetical protein